MKKKKYIILGILILSIIAIIILNFSEARNTITVSVTLKDSESTVADKEMTLDAVNENDAGYYIILPEEIDGKYIEKFYIEETTIISSEVTEETEENTEIEEDTQLEENAEESTSLNEEDNVEETETIEENNETEETVEETISDEEIANSDEKESESSSKNAEIENNEDGDSESEDLSEEESVVESSTKIVEKLPGEKVYLTEEQQNNAQITLNIKYDYVTVDNEKMYNQNIQETTEKNEVTVTGYLPEDATLEIEEVSSDDIQDLVQDNYDTVVEINVAYDIKIISNNQEFEPEAIGQDVKVSISGLDIEGDNRVVHINDDNEIEEVEIEVEDETITFEADSFSIYIVLTVTDEEVEVTVNVWSGETATKFSFGSGTSDDPYLIASGAELAYLAQEVNGGNTYSGIYFKLAADIDLNSEAWTPIGDATNYFGGVFDGDGYSISNMTIEIADTAAETYAYGVFGSIGGTDSSMAIIKNVQFDNITIAISTDATITSNDFAYKIGIVAGAMYRYSEIQNVIVKNSQITHSGTITAGTTTTTAGFGTTTTYYYPIIYAGGIVGEACYSSTSSTTSTTTGYYIIDNCYADVDITINTALTQVYQASRFNIGGIIGRISMQNSTWPTNCLYTGSITSANSTIGPIYGGETTTTTTYYTTLNNVSNNIWYRNSNSTITSYYTVYTANGTSFTTSSVSRISTVNTNIGYVQGVNRGQYTTAISSTMLSMFNENAEEDGNLSWVYENGEFSFYQEESTLKVQIVEDPANTYTIVANSTLEDPTYTYKWYVNGVLQEDYGEEVKIEPSLYNDIIVQVEVSDGTNTKIINFTISQYTLYLELTYDESTNSLTAELAGTYLKYLDLDDYTYQWYIEEIAGDSTKIEGETSLTLEGVEEGIEYKIVATNSENEEYTVEATYILGDRIVIFVNYSGGNDNNDGYTPETAVKTLPTAYGKLDSDGSVNNNIIVIMGDYTTRDVFVTQSNSTYEKSVTITGKYKSTDYAATLLMYYDNTFNFINGDTVFQYLIFRGSTNEQGAGNAYIFAQGYNVTMGEQIYMERYDAASTVQGLITGSAPSFTLFGGYYQYNLSTLPRNNSIITIKSGVYGRIVLGGSLGNLSTTSMAKTTSHNFIGSSYNDMFTCTVNIDIQNSTNNNGYAYDVNLLVGGSAWGNTYADITENIYAGSVGRVLGASIGDSTYGQSSINNGRWDYPLNTYIGYTTINVYGGTIEELYGGCLGRNMNSSGNTCDSYFYGEIEINIYGGEINSAIYGAGAGGVTGYSENSSDEYKSYGVDIETTVTINLYDGDINGDIFGGGYGYTEYLQSDSAADDGGTLYGTSIINIIGGNIYGSVYGGGKGYYADSYPSALGQMYGNSYIYVSGDAYIEGEIYGAGQGVSGQTETALFVGTTNIEITADLEISVYGGGNIALTEGETYIYIKSGDLSEATVYGGGNEGEVTGSSYIYITGANTGNIFGGGNQAGITNTYIYLTSGTVTNIYGGSNQSGNVDETNVIVNSGTAYQVYGGNNAGGTTVTSYVIINGGSVTDVYGGNNAGGTTTTSNVTINTGDLTNVYGGGNQAETGTTNVLINDGTIQNIYGGGNQADVKTPTVIMQAGTVGNIFGGGNAAGVTTSTFLDINGGTVETNVYGGGNEGTVTENTYVYLTDCTISGSAYAGGNGVAATVYGNTNICVDGLTVVGTDESVSPQSGCVFGGGNAAATGIEENNSSIAKVNIAGASIYGNVYGGANTSVVYGSTLLNIGNTVIDVEKRDEDDEINIDVQDIYIKGTIFGGGEANASGSEVYDFSFISVTKGIEIYIDATGHDEFSTTGSIFGSGNASSSQGDSYIYISNYGTIDNPQDNISIQRATLVTLDNSAISLSGVTDRTNEYSDTKFTLSRLDELKLKNGSTLYLDCGANLLQKLSSVVDVDGVEKKATVTIDEETGETEKNVDNRIYMYQGKVLNIATNQSVTTFGEVYGMTFLGMYTSTVNPSSTTGLYSQNYSNGDEITNAGTFSSNTYVLGQHMVDHDITVDGFWTNENDEENLGYVKCAYVGVTPEEDIYYMWIVGEALDVTTFEISLTASKYATLGTYELVLTGFSTPNLKMSIIALSLGLENGIELIDPDDVENIASEESTANSVYGITMETGNNGWQTNSLTSFLTENDGTYEGSKEYDSDNSTYTPTLLFCLYHSQNLTEEKDLGEMTIRLQVLTPVDDLTYKISYIDIIITLNTALYQDDYYEAAIAPGEKFSLFTSTETNITTTSELSTYYSLYIPDFLKSNYYNSYWTSYRVLISTNYETGEAVVFNEGTKITMLDLVSNEYYYYIVTEDDENSGKYIYNLSDFIPMGSTNGTFDESEKANTYYVSDQDLIYEEYIFQVDFENSGIEEDMTNNTLLIELRNNNQTLLGVLGIERDTMIYGLYSDKDATIEVSLSVSDDTVYLGNSFNLNVTTVLTQSVVDSKIVYDTEFFNQQMGVKITVFDNNGNQLTADSLLGIEFILDDVSYYARVDGTVRINTAEKVTNVLSKITIDTSKNTTLATGTYTIQVDSFGSSDGIYYGLEPSDTATITVTIINSSYGIEVSTEDECKIVDKETGNTQNDNNEITATISYSSGLDNPIIKVSLYRRDYSSIYNQNYNLVDLADYITNSLTASSTENEYIFSESPTDTMTDTLYLNENLTSGTYKLVYSLYDGETYIGEAYDYIIIK